MVVAVLIIRMVWQRYRVVTGEEERGLSIKLSNKLIFMLNYKFCLIYYKERYE